MDLLSDFFGNALLGIFALDAPERILHKFKALTEIYSKVNFMEDLLIEIKCYEKLMFKLKLRKDKCNIKSLELRKRGNAQFSMKKTANYFQALELWNESICYSEPGSENLSIGYANRSAVLYEWKRYRECLANIDLARKANYPARLMHKLDKREEDCRQLLATQLPDPKLFDFQLTYKPHPQVPNIADCLELKQTKAEGRFIITKRNLCVGDVIAIEKPFCSVLKPEMCYKRCVTCKAENYLTLIPCENCCSTMFCSEDCRQEALATFHKYECPIIDFMHQTSEKGLDVAVRACLTALVAFGTIEELMEFCADPKNQNKSALDLDYTNFTQREHYRAIHGLETNQHLQDKLELFISTLCCAFLKHFLMNNTPLKEILGGVEGENFFTELLCRHMLTTAINSFGIQINEKAGSTFPIISKGLFAYFSLLNHSCAPNVELVVKGTKSFLYVMRPITAGGGIYYSYGNNFLTKTYEERHEILSKNYSFNCKCEACENEYPIEEELSANMCLPYVSDEDEFFNYDFALANYKKICNFLMENADAYPCPQIAHAELSLFCAFNTLADAVSFKDKLH